MGNEDNSLTLGYQAFENSKKLKYLLRPQHSSRFIHNQDVCGSIQDFENLYSLLQTYRKFFDTDIGINWQTILFAQLENYLVSFFYFVHCSKTARLMSQNNIFRHG